MMIWVHSEREKKRMRGEVYLIYTSLTFHQKHQMPSCSYAASVPDSIIPALLCFAFLPQKK